jgi:signal transduction histidine kinase
MRLADFILENQKPILAEWEAFAASCAPASGSMDVSALADHASAMLVTIANDLNTAQGKREQSEKSKGRASPATGQATAAGEHGAARAESGFTIAQMVAEFRALRATVIKLWTKEKSELRGDDVKDLTRFNEAIDQAVAESVVRFTGDLEESKEIFLGILGHDLRSPLSAVMMSASFMLETEELTEPHLTLTRRIASSSKRMEQMIGDLLDFTRSRLGGGIPIVRAPMRLEKAIHDVVDEILAADPSRSIKVEARAGEEGNWDCARISQAIGNLIGNALEHGMPGGEVTVKLDGNASEACIAVHNTGPPLSPDQLNGIFSSMKSTGRGKKGGGSSDPLGHLGLGLYISERIVHAHDGRIDVESTESGGTTFTIVLPRTPKAA